MKVLRVAHIIIGEGEDKANASVLRLTDYPIQSPAFKTEARCQNGKA